MPDLEARPDSDTAGPSDGAAVVINLDELKKTDEDLYRLMKKDHAGLTTDSEARRAVIGAMDAFVARLEQAAKQLDPVTIDDYNWLSDTALRWEVIYASIFNLPKEIVISVPPERLKRPEQSSVYSAEQVEKWISDRAYDLSRIRKVRTLLGELDAVPKRIPSSEAEMRADWRYAQVEFASQVLAGRMNFATQFASDSYPRLQEVWLHEVKRHRAFGVWEEHGCLWNADEGIQDYEEACCRLGTALLAPELKAVVPEEFGEARAYLELNYLDSAGRLDPGKPAVNAMVACKAEHLAWRTGNGNELENWFAAESYVHRFFGNVISAVVEKSVYSTRVVLDALHDSEGRKAYGIADAFEAALAIYFIDPKTIAATGVGTWL
jgi:hypothetical protein